MTVDAASSVKLDSLRVRIDGHWTSEDFSSFFEAVDALYIFFGLQLRGDRLGATLYPERSTLAWLSGPFEEEEERARLLSVLGRVLAPKDGSGAYSFLDGLQQTPTDELLRDWYVVAKLHPLLTHLLRLARLQRKPGFHSFAEAKGNESNKAIRHPALFYAAHTDREARLAENRVMTRALLGAQSPLQVAKLLFASPGHTDLVGAGQIIGHLKEFLLELFKLSQTKKEALARVRKLEAEARLLDAQSDEIRVNALTKKLKALQELGYSKEQCIYIAADVDQQVHFLLELMQKRQIVGVEDADHIGGA